MNLTYKVNIWEIKTLKPDKNGKKRPKPYGVRWITAGQEHSEWYRTKALANNRRNQLIKAMNNGEGFDVVSGLPESELKAKSARSLLKLAQEFISHEWDGAAPNTRKRHVDACAIPVAAFVSTQRDAPPAEVLRRVLTTHLLMPEDKRTRALTPEQEAAARWIEKFSRPARELADQIELDKVLRTLARKLDGTKTTAWTAKSRRAVISLLMAFGHKVGEFGTNPMSGLRASQEDTVNQVDPRSVVNPKQGRQLLAAVTYAGRRPGWYDYLYGFFASMYYAGLRPGEANRLRETDCKLPETGWGELLLEKSAPREVARFTDTGVGWEERNLKRRPDGATRPVPIPPALVRILRWHLDTFGTTPDGRLFRGVKSGEPLHSAVYTAAWQQVRKVGLSPKQQASPLAADPYSLRHAAVSTWLAAGLSPVEVAERAGHSVAVLLKVYAAVLDGQQETSNQKIGDLLGDD